MRTRPVSDPAPIPLGISILCALALLTGWLVLRGASFAFAIPAKPAHVNPTLAQLIHPPRRRRGAARTQSGTARILGSGRARRGASGAL